MAVEQIAYKLSTRAIRMIKSGKATLTPGGIRDVNTGRILELVKPVMTKTFTQREMLTNISQSLKTVQALQWVGTSLSLVNVGVSVAGFYAMLKKMNSIEGELRQFIDEFNADHKSERIENYNNHLQKITNHLSYLQSRYTSPVFDQHDFMIRRVDIEDECIEAGNFLIRVLNDFQSGREENRLACQIIFTLAPVYAQLINEYCCQYYCLCGNQHNQFSTWLSVLDQINGASFRSFMKRQMAFNVEYVDIYPQRRKDVLDIAFDSIEEMKDNLLMCAETIKNVPEHSLIPVENLLQEKLWNDMKNAVRPELGESSEEYITQKIMQMAIDDNEEEVILPVQTRYA